VPVGRCAVPLPRLAALAPVLVVALLLAWSADGQAEDGTAGPATQTSPVAPVPEAASAAAPDAAPGRAEVTPESPIADAPRTRAPRPRIHRTPGQGIDETVGRLTRGLGLDAAQQAKLREILWDEQMQVRRMRENPGAGVDWASTTAMLVGRTKARIRAMLSDEQKKKYPVDVPRDGLAPAQADVQHWMQLQDSRRQQDAGAPK